MGNENIKIGARNLEDDELRILLPEWENIFLEIQKIRKTACRNQNNEDKVYMQITKEEHEFTKHHNNVFSILGERGAGKTSVQLSLKYKIMEKALQDSNEKLSYQRKEESTINCNSYKKDTILPLIVPQDMEEDSTAIAWIIAYFSKIVDEIEKEAVENRGLFFYKVGSIRINPVSEKFKELKKSLFIRTENYRKELTSKESIMEYVEKNQEAIRENINLSKKFKEFIDEYIEFKMNTGIKTDVAPLIYIFFDDVDISNRKCLMVLETIMRYLSHQNIVVFVAGDYSTFKETVTLKYLKDDGLLYKDLLYETFEKKTALEIRQTLAYDYLKKVLSPALRYELKKYSQDEKRVFRFQKEVKLEDMLKNILQYPEMYYDLLDSKPRGLINIYYFLSQNQKLQKWETETIQKFVSIIIDSSSYLNTEKENILDILNRATTNNLISNLSQLKTMDFRFQTYLLYKLNLELKQDGDLKIDNEYEFLAEYLSDKIGLDIKIKRDITNIFLYSEENDFINMRICIEILKKISEDNSLKDNFLKLYLDVLNNIFETQEGLAKYFNDNFYLNRNKITVVFEMIIRGIKENNTVLGAVNNRVKKLVPYLHILDEFKSTIDALNFEKNINIKSEVEESHSIYIENSSLLDSGLSIERRTLIEQIESLKTPIIDIKRFILEVKAQKINLLNEKKIIEITEKLGIESNKYNFLRYNILNEDRIYKILENGNSTTVILEKLSILDNKISDMESQTYNYEILDKICDDIIAQLKKLGLNIYSLEVKKLKESIQLCSVLSKIYLNLDNIESVPISSLYKRYSIGFRAAIKNDFLIKNTNYKPENIETYIGKIIDEISFYEEKLLEREEVKRLESEVLIDLFRNKNRSEMGSYITDNNIINVKKVMNFAYKNKSKLEQGIMNELDNFLQVNLNRVRSRFSKIMPNKDVYVVIAYLELLKTFVYIKLTATAVVSKKENYDLNKFKEQLNPELRRIFLKELNR